MLLMYTELALAVLEGMLFLLVGVTLIVLLIDVLLS